MSKFFAALVRYKWYIIILLIGTVVLYQYLNKEPVSPFETIVVEKGNVVQEVSVTGRVDADNTVDLSFEKSGRVTAVLADVGDKVDKADILVKLDSSELTALRAQAKANLDYESARLSEIKKGTRVEDIAISQVKVDNARISLEDAARGLVDKLHIGYTQSDDAIRNKVDILLSNPRTNNPELIFVSSDTKLSIQVPPARASLEKKLSEWVTVDGTLQSSRELMSDTIKIEGWMNDVKSYLNLLAGAVNGVLPNSQVSATTIETWKSSISVARSNVNTAITSVLAADEKYRSALGALNIAENELALKKAGATPESVSAQEAKIESMRATVLSYDAQLKKNQLLAPFDAVVTKQNAKLGQSVVAGQDLVSLISDGKYRITANVPEVDVAKVKIGDKADVTLDAYGSDNKFSATVFSIDPAETIIEGVPTYKVTLLFSESDVRIKSGMTANIIMRTEEKTNVMVVPARAILLREGEKIERFVRVPDPSGMSAREVPVVVGLRGSNGMVEIISGLSEGDKVVTFEKVTVD